MGYDRRLWFALVAAQAAAGLASAQFNLTSIGGGAVGSLTTNGPGSYTVVGGGNDIWSGTDEFTFAYATVSGDFDVRVRVESFQPTARWSKAGLMARESLTPTSRMAFNRVTPAEVPTSSGGVGANDTRFGYRTGTSSPQLGEHEDGAGSPNFPNAWLRLARAGNAFLAYRSANGRDWVLQGQQDTTAWEGGAVAANLHVGLGVARHSGPLPTATAEFRNYANVRAGPPVLVQQPAAVVAPVGASATFSVDVAGGYDVVRYHWRTNGVRVPGATNQTYVIGPLTLAQSNTLVTVLVTNTVNSLSVTSATAVLTVTTAPVLMGVSSRGQPDRVYVTFSEPMEAASALSVTNYQLVAGGLPLPLSSAGFDSTNLHVVVLTTSLLTEGRSYRLTVMNVRDRSVPVLTLTPNPSTRDFKLTNGAPCYDFNAGQPGGTAVFGTAYVDADGGVTNSGVLKLTVSANSQQGSFLTGDALAGSPAFRFAVGFKAFVGGGTTPPADGFSFNFAHDLPNASFGEEGAGTGLTVAFDNYDNGGGEAPAIDVKWGGVTVAHTPVASLSTGMDFVPVTVNLAEGGGLSVTYGGLLVHSNLSFGYTPVRGGRFGFGARTGGLNDNHWIDDLCLSLFTPGSVLIVSQPQSRTVTEPQTATFSATLEGTPPYAFQWLSNNVPIPGATDWTYTTPPTRPAMTGTVYRVRASNDFSSVLSAGAVLTVLTDTTPPTLARAVGDASLTQVTVSFSEPVTLATATNVGNYSITFPGGSLPVLSAALTNGSNVILRTAPQAQNTNYTVRVSNVRDTSEAQNVIAPNSPIAFTAWLFSPGFLTFEAYNAGPGNEVWRLTGHPDFPTNPRETLFMTRFDTRTVYPDDGHDEYGARISGWFVPPVSGAWTLYLRSDDASQLFLSSDANPSNKVLIAEEPACCNAFSAHPSPPVGLSAGQSYYVEALYKEGIGGDLCQVAAKLTSDPTNPDLLGTVPGTWLGTFANPDTAGTVTITQHPQPVSTVVHHTATFTVAAVNSLGRPQFYQWQRLGATWTNIPGANAASYITPLLTLADNDSRFRAVVWVPGRQATSFSALLSVGPDTAPPVPLSAASVDVIYYGLCFDELVDPASATNPANYTAYDLVYGGFNTVLNVTLRPDGQSVLLQMLNGVQRNGFLINGVQDLSGNVTSNAYVVGEFWAASVDVGFPTLPGSAFSCRAGDADVTVGGRDIWDGADQFHYLYKDWAGDFDVKVKVPRLDPADYWSKAGLMARTTLNDNSPAVGLLTTPAGSQYANILQGTLRPAFGAPTVTWGPSPITTLPDLWLRLMREGDLFTGYHGTDGVNWTYFGSVTQPLGTYTFLGLATTSHNTGAVTTAEFRGFAATSSRLIVVQPQSQTVPSGAYVILSVTVSGPEPITYQWRLNGRDIPGATGSSYVIHSAQPADGGSYTVLVTSPLGFELSQPAEVVIETQPLPVSDDFEGAPVIESWGDCANGSNLLASAQFDEPRHAGQPGGRSVWVTWRAMLPGVVEFSTRGSSFDTLLAAYTGGSLTSLHKVTSADDDPDSSTGTIRFNVVPGTDYRIAIDGFGAAAGAINLCWNFQPFAPPAPELFLVPTNRTVAAGTHTTFRVVATNAQFYQWSFNGHPLPLAQSNQLFIPSVQRSNVGYYQVTAWGFDSPVIAVSPRAYLEIGSAPTRYSEVKFENVRSPSEIVSGSGVLSDRFFGLPFVNPPGPRSLQRLLGLLPIASGTLDSQILNNTNSFTQQGESNHCGTLTAATRWFGLEVATNATNQSLVVDTAGSDIETVLALYRGNDILSLTNLGCALGKGVPITVGSAIPGEVYYAAVDGTNGQQGVIKLNWKLGRAPGFTLHPTNKFAQPASSTTFNALADGVPAPRYQWYSNSVAILSATNANLTLANVRSNHAASYYVTASNFMGVATSAAARLTVGYPYTLGWARVTSNASDTVMLRLPTNALATNILVIQASTNLIHWAGIRTNVPPPGLTNFVDPARTNIPCRFYRLWPLGQP